MMRKRTGAGAGEREDPGEDHARPIFPLRSQRPY